MISEAEPGEWNQPTMLIALAQNTSPINGSRVKTPASKPRTKAYGQTINETTNKTKP